MLTFALRPALIVALLFLGSIVNAQDLSSPAFQAYARGDYESALRLNGPALAEKNAEALWLMGVMQATGAGVERNNQRAIESLTAGVDAGATYGLTLIGNIYQEGGYGVDQDIAKAAQVYETAAEQGYADAQWLLGELYLTSTVVGIRPSKAAMLFGQAALQEHPEALYSLALLYLSGQGVEKNPAGASDLFNLAAIAGNSAGALRLAEMMDKGDGIPADADNAAFYFVIAAELGNADAIPAAKAARKSMNFRVAKQIAFENSVDAWFREHGYTRIPIPSAP